jgi:hypothetical protein
VVILAIDACRKPAVRGPGQFESKALGGRGSTWQAAGCRTRTRGCDGQGGLYPTCRESKSTASLADLVRWDFRYTEGKFPMRAYLRPFHCIGILEPDIVLSALMVPGNSLTKFFCRLPKIATTDSLRDPHGRDRGPRLAPASALRNQTLMEKHRPG